MLKLYQTIVYDHDLRFETTEQARYLRARGCTIGQGYIFSRAVPAAEVCTILATQSYDHWVWHRSAVVTTS